MRSLATFAALCAASSFYRSSDEKSGGGTATVQPPATGRGLAAFMNRGANTAEPVVSAYSIEDFAKAPRRIPIGSPYVVKQTPGIIAVMEGPQPRGSTPQRGEMRYALIEQMQVSLVEFPSSRGKAKDGEGFGQFVKQVCIETIGREIKVNRAGEPELTGDGEYVYLDPEPRVCHRKTVRRQERSNEPGEEQVVLMTGTGEGRLGVPVLPTQFRRADGSTGYREGTEDKSHKGWAECAAAMETLKDIAQSSDEPRLKEIMAWSNIQPMAGGNQSRTNARPVRDLQTAAPKLGNSPFGVDPNQLESV